MIEQPQVALVAPFSGPRRAWGQLLLEAADRRRDIDWLRVDDEGRAELGQACAERVVASRAVIVLGHFNSGGAARAIPVYARAGIPSLLPLATAPGLVQLAPGLVLRECPTDADQASALMSALADEVVAVIDDGSRYGRGLAERLVVAGAQPATFSRVVNWPGAVVIAAVHVAAAELASLLRSAGCKARFAFVDDCGVQDFTDLADGAAADALLAQFPGGAPTCVTTLVEALAEAVHVAPAARGRSLLKEVRRASSSEYDALGERLGATWEIVAFTSSGRPR